MPPYLNPELTIERAGRVLEREFRQRFGEEYERMYRTIDLLAEEHSTDQEQQVLGIIIFIGSETTTQINLFLALVWLSKKEMSDLTAREMLDILRRRTVAQILLDTRKAVQESPTD